MCVCVGNKVKNKLINYWLFCCTSCAIKENGDTNVELTEENLVI